MGIKSSTTPKGGTPKDTVNSTRTIRKDTKIFSMLKQFSAGKHLHRFQAERLGDHCLHSTVSSISSLYGLVFEKQWVEVPTNYNVLVKVKSYWFEGKHLARARVITNTNNN